MKDFPLVSIITATLNNKDIIEECLVSVFNQTYKNIELIIIDGSSIDGTTEIINKYKTRIAKFVSEEDQGLYYAINKGISLATGEIVSVLNADDVYASKETVENVVEALAKNNTDTCYGDLVYVSRKNINRVIRYWYSAPYSWDKLRFGWMPPHPAFFVKKEVYNKYGVFNTDFKISSDYEIILRFLYKNKIPACYIARVLLKMRLGGLSNKNIKNIVRKSWEDYKICRMYNLGFKALLMKNIVKLPQFIFRA